MKNTGMTRKCMTLKFTQFMSAIIMNNNNKHMCMWCLSVHTHKKKLGQQFNEQKFFYMICMFIYNMNLFLTFFWQIRNKRSGYKVLRVFVTFFKVMMTLIGFNNSEESIGSVAAFLILCLLSINWISMHEQFYIKSGRGNFLKSEPFIFASGMIFISMLIRKATFPGS